MGAKITITCPLHIDIISPHQLTLYSMVAPRTTSSLDSLLFDHLLASCRQGQTIYTCPMDRFWTSMAPTLKPPGLTRTQADCSTPRPPLTVRLSRFVENVYIFFGLYFVSLFSVCSHPPIYHDPSSQTESTALFVFFRPPEQPLTPPPVRPLQCRAKLQVQRRQSAESLEYAIPLGRK